MTMLDDDRLTALFAQAGATFDVPASGADDILDRAAGRQPPDVAGRDGEGEDEFDEGDRLDGRDLDGPDLDGPDLDDAAFAGLPGAPGRLRRVTGLASRHRVLSVAACLVLVLVVAGAVGALARGPVRSSGTDALAKVHAPVPVRTPSTTTTTGLGFGTNGASGQDQQALPYSTSHGAPAGASGGLSSATNNAPTTTPTSAPALPKGAVGQPARIQQTGSLELTVGRGRLERTMTQLTNLASAFGGFVANSQTQSAAAGGGTASGNVTLQVPVDNFATVLKRAQALGKTSGLTTKATDVTGQYVDLQSRITALQVTLQQYLTILAKATTVGDVLAVQEQVNTIQSQIEQLQGQLQLLTSQTAYSALGITVSEGTPAPPPSSLPESGLVRAWHASIGGFVSGVEGVIRIAGPLLFALLLAGVVLLGGRSLWRRYQRHNL